MKTRKMYPDQVDWSKSDKEIARELGVSVPCVNQQRPHNAARRLIYQLLGLLGIEEQSELWEPGAVLLAYATLPDQITRILNLPVQKLDGYRQRLLASGIMDEAGRMFVDWLPCQDDTNSISLCLDIMVAAGQIVREKPGSSNIVQLQTA